MNVVTNVVMNIVMNVVTTSQWSGDIDIAHSQSCSVISILFRMSVAVGKWVISRFGWVKHFINFLFNFRQNFLSFS